MESLVGKAGVPGQHVNGRIKRPDFFLVGAPKCGTTGMAAFLGRHPDVFMAPKEMHFFGSDLRFGKQFNRRTLRSYMAEYAPRNGHFCAGEASVWYLFSKRAASEIKAFNPDARIIIMLREPTEMLYSLFYEFLFNGNETLPNFPSALEAEESRKTGLGLGRRTLIAAGLLYHETARYASQVERYLEAFGNRQVHVILYDDLVRDPVGVGRSVLDFLGVDPGKASSSPSVVNANKYARNRFLQLLLTEPALQVFAGFFWPWLPRIARSGLRKLRAQITSLNTIVKPRPEMPGETRARLKRDFQSDVKQLGRLLERDLTHWSE